MIKKLLLVCVLFLTSCQYKVSTEDKKSLVNELNVVLKSGDVEKLSTLTNQDIAITLPTTSNIDMKAIFSVIYSDEEVIYIEKEGVDYLKLPSFDLKNILKNATITTQYIEGENIAKKELTQEELKTKFFENIQKLKNENRIEREIPVKFVVEKKQLKFDFNDAETINIINAILGRK